MLNIYLFIRDLLATGAVFSLVFNSVIHGVHTYKAINIDT